MNSGAQTSGSDPLGNTDVPTQAVETNKREEVLNMRQLLVGEEISIAGRRAFCSCEVTKRKHMFHSSICFTALSNE